MESKAGTVPQLRPVLSTTFCRFIRLLDHCAPQARGQRPRRIDELAAKSRASTKQAVDG